MNPFLSQWTEKLDAEFFSDGEAFNAEVNRKSFYEELGKCYKSLLEDISLRLPKEEDLVKLVDEDSRIWYETGYNQALAEVQDILTQMK